MLKIKRNTNLKIECIKKDVKIYELANSIGVTPDYLSKVIMGIRNLSPEKKNMAAKILGTSSDYLFKE